MKEKFLPIGTVVLLKGGKKELMITGYCIIPNGQELTKDNKELNMRDYCACTYPEGIINSDVAYAFNHDQIDKICFMGYETEASKEVSKSIIENIDQVKQGVLEEINKNEAD